MVPSPLRRSKPSFHTRSISLPSRSHPLIPQFNEHLGRIKTFEATTSYSLSSINTSLNGLQDLYDCVDDLLMLPHTQQAFAQECHEKWVDEVLEGYLGLLDACATIKDVFSQTRHDTQGLLSILRRKKDANDHVSRYLTSKKTAKKVAHKSLKALKSNSDNKRSLISMEKDNETMAIVSMLNEVESTTMAVFDSLLSYVAGIKPQSKLSKWSFVSKLKDTETTDIQKVDIALISLVCSKTNKCDETENVQNRLGKLESSIQDVEDGLENLFKRLIKTRVSLLNIISH